MLNDERKDAVAGVIVSAEADIMRNPFSSRLMTLSVAGLFALLGVYFIFSSFAAATTYYVDCSIGSDTASGTSSTTPWKSIAKANSAAMEPGSQLLLKRGCTWNETLTAKWNGTATSPITISAYGDPAVAKPTITSNVSHIYPVYITGSYQVFDSIYAKAIPPSTVNVTTSDPNCNNKPTASGDIKNFALMSGSHHNEIRNSKTTGGYAGVFINGGSYNNKIINNEIVDNLMMSPVSVGGNDDAGAFGVGIVGDYNEIAYNQINGHSVCSFDYVTDGGAVELFGGQHNYIHHNKAHNNDAFSELGNSRTKDTTFAYNLVTSDSAINKASFINTRGVNDGFGPVYDTKVYNNTAYLTGNQSKAVICYGGCGTGILTLKNNVIWGNTSALYADAPFIESNNVYWSANGYPAITIINGALSASSKKANPMFTAAGSDFRLQTGSPAVDTGINLNLGYNADLTSPAVAVPNGSAPDMGAYEYGTSVSTTTSSPPVVQVVKPTNGSTFSGPIPVQANAAATSPATVNRVEFFLDNVAQTPADSNAPYCMRGVTDSTCGNWDSTTVANGTHTITAYAYDSTGAKSQASTVTFTVSNGTTTTTTTTTTADTTKPSAPALSGKAASQQAVLTWMPATDNVGVTRYEVWKNNGYVTQLPASITSYTASGLANGTSYTFRVVAYDAANNYANSNNVTVTPAASSDTQAPSAPAGLVAGAVSATSVSLSWNAATDNVGVVKYNVLRGGVVIGTTTSLSYTDNSTNTPTPPGGPVAATSYSYTVKAIDAANNASPDSAALAVTTPAVSDTTPPSTPTNLTAKAISSYQVNVAWTASTDTGGSGLKGYNVYRGTTATLDPAAAPLNGGTPLSATSYGDGTVKPDVTYYYWVKAVDAAPVANVSAAAGPATIKVPALSVEKAKGKPTAASSTSADGYGRILRSWYANDGFTTVTGDGVTPSRWSSSFSENQWWQVDLGTSTPVSRVDVKWETAYASHYLIQGSTDGVNFSTLADVSNTAAGLKSTAFTETSTRYVRILGLTRGTQWGLSIWEAQVYGTPL